MRAKRGEFGERAALDCFRTSLSARGRRRRGAREKARRVRRAFFRSGGAIRTTPRYVRLPQSHLVEMTSLLCGVEKPKKVKISEWNPEIESAAVTALGPAIGTILTSVPSARTTSATSHEPGSENGRRAGVAHEARGVRALAQFFNDAFDHGRVGIRIESFYGCMNIKMRQ